jgi:regulatory protein YycI of two-component signal transduction system YycFG
MKNKALLIFLFLLITVVATNKIVDNKSIADKNSTVKNSGISTTLPDKGFIVKSGTKNENDSLSALFNRHLMLSIRQNIMWQLTSGIQFLEPMRL